MEGEKAPERVFVHILGCCSFPPSTLFNFNPPAPCQRDCTTRCRALIQYATFLTEPANGPSTQHDFGMSEILLKSTEIVIKRLELVSRKRSSMQRSVAKQTKMVPIVGGR